MTRDEAVGLIQELAKAEGITTQGLNEKNFGGLTLGAADVYFEFHEPFLKTEPTLECSALIYRFHREPSPRLIEAFEEEGRSGTPAGGGEVDYEPENLGLFLTRIYAGPPDPDAFRADIKALAEAAQRWGGEVLERVTQRVFNPPRPKT